MSMVASLNRCKASVFQTYKEEFLPFKLAYDFIDFLDTLCYNFDCEYTKKRIVQPISEFAYLKRGNYEHRWGES